jgi:hypothetical protein
VPCVRSRAVFRALTLLAVTHCEQSGTPFGPEVLTPALLAELVSCLSFGKHGEGGAFDIAINGYGMALLVSQCANTTLKDAKVGKNIPTVAKMTQGEVIAFAAKAAELMRADGMNVRSSLQRSATLAARPTCPFALRDVALPRAACALSRRHRRGPRTGPSTTRGVCGRCSWRGVRRRSTMCERCTASS